MKLPAAVTIVIFGGSGDLAHRKLLPALYNLHVDRLLPPKIAVVGVGRKEMSDDAYRAFAKDGVTQFSRRPIDEAAWETFARTLCFVNMSLDDERGFATLGARLDSVEHAGGLTGDRIYYLAIPPALFAPTVKQLARSRLVARASQRPEPFARIIVEKPIGRDLESARTINDALAEVFDEEQIYRIDHYLGKETVQNILVLRFANSIFEPLMNQRHVDHVQISVAEEEGSARAATTNQAGALRDMVQNHLLQLLALIAMEPPHSLSRGRPATTKSSKCCSRCDRSSPQRPTPDSPRSARWALKAKPGPRTRGPKRSWRCGSSSTTGDGRRAVFLRTGRSCQSA
jgi:glucose-6-phosphate 1-dehydrogenase